MHPARVRGRLPDGPEREALFDVAKRVAVAFAPYKTPLPRFNNDLVQPWLLGCRRTLFWQDWWHRVDIDLSQHPVVPCCKRLQAGGQAVF